MVIQLSSSFATRTKGYKYHMEKYQDVFPMVAAWTEVTAVHRWYLITCGWWGQVLLITSLS